MSRKTENEKNAGSSVNDLESLTTSLCEVYNGFNGGKIEKEDVKTFTKMASEIVKVKNQMLKEKKFELQLREDVASLKKRVIK